MRADRRTEESEESNSHFLQLCKRTLKTSCFVYRMCLCFILSSQLTNSAFSNCINSSVLSVYMSCTYLLYAGTSFPNTQVCSHTLLLQLFKKGTVKTYAWLEAGCTSRVEVSWLFHARTAWDQDKDSGIGIRIFTTTDEVCNVEEKRRCLCYHGTWFIQSQLAVLLNGV